MATSYHQLGMLAQTAGDYDEADRQYQRALDINERLGDQAGMASSYHQLGVLAQDRGDYDEADPPVPARPWTSANGSATRPAWPPATTSSASWPSCGGTTTTPSRQYQPRPGHQRAARRPGQHGHQLPPARHAGPGPRGLRRGRPPVPALPGHQRAARRPGRHGHQLPPARHPGPGPRGLRRRRAASTSRALDINERLGDQAGMANSYHQLGMLAQLPRGLRRRRAAVPAAPWTSANGSATRPAWPPPTSQLGILEAERGTPAAAVIARHVTALAIRLRLGTPQAAINLRRLAALRDDLGPEQFTALLGQATGDTGQAETIISLLDQTRRRRSAGTTWPGRRRTLPLNGNRS